MTTNWQTTFRLPENSKHVPKGTIASGSSPDAQFIFDAIYAHEANVFVLTLLHINNELGFIEGEKRQYLTTLPDLQAAIAHFMNAPHHAFEHER